VQLLQWNLWVPTSSIEWMLLAMRELSLSGIRVKPLEILKKSHSCQTKVFAFHKSRSAFSLVWGACLSKPQIRNRKESRRKARESREKAGEIRASGLVVPCQLTRLHPIVVEFFVSGVVRDFNGGVG